MLFAFADRRTANATRGLSDENEYHTESDPF
jgi:hypothetical protein